MGSIKIGSKGLKFYAPLTDKYLQSSTLASDVSAYRNHANIIDGTVTYSSEGADFQVNDRIRFPGTDIFNEDEFTIALRFTPHFETDHNGWDFIFSSTSTNYTIIKTPNASGNTLRAYAGGVITSIPEATYSPFWNSFQENTIVFSGIDSTNQVDVWLNNNQIVSTTVSWGKQNPSQLLVAGSNFDGKIRDLMIFNRVWTAQERLAFETSPQGLYAPKKSNQLYTPRKTSDLDRGLILDIPLTPKWAQSSTVPSDRSFSHLHPDNSFGTPTFDDEGMTLDGSSHIYRSNVLLGKQTFGGRGVISAWIKTTLGGTVFSVADTSGTNYWTYFRVLSTGILLYQVFYLAHNAMQCRGTALVNDGEWHHVAVLGTHTHGAPPILYVDGVEDPLSYDQDGTTEWFSFHPRDTFTIGALRRSVVSVPFIGTMKNFKVWDQRILTADEMFQVYRQGR